MEKLDSSACAATVLRRATAAGRFSARYACFVRCFRRIATFCPHSGPIARLNFKRSEMPKLPDLSHAAVMKRQVLAEAERTARENTPPPPPMPKKIRIATRLTSPSRRSKRVH
jgi:hypothetical protein